MDRQRLFSRRKAQAEIISWVLIVGFMVALGTFMFFWLTDRSRISISQINQYASDTADCDYVSVHIDSSCKDMQKIYLNVSNAGSLPIDALIFRSYDLSAQPMVRQRNVTIRPRAAKAIVVFKEAITDKLEIIPLTTVSGKKIFCSKKMIKMDSIPQCPWVSANIT